MKKRLNRLESLALQREKMAQGQAGTGRFLFKNRTKGEILLPKTGLDGKRRVHPNETFEGDSYFFHMVPRELIIVENLEKESAMNKPQVLLTEQPPVYTSKGHVEYVQQEKVLVEQPKKPEGKLIVEPANDSVIVVR